MAKLAWALMAVACTLLPTNAWQDCRPTLTTTHTLTRHVDADGQVAWLDDVPTLESLSGHACRDGQCLRMGALTQAETPILRTLEHDSACPGHVIVTHTAVVTRISSRSDIAGQDGSYGEWSLAAAASPSGRFYDQEGIENNSADEANPTGTAFEDTVQPEKVELHSSSSSTAKISTTAVTITVGSTVISLSPGEPVTVRGTTISVGKALKSYFLDGTPYKLPEAMKTKSSAQVISTAVSEGTLKYNSTSTHSSTVVVITAGGVVTSVKPGQQIIVSSKTFSLGRAGNTLYSNGIPSSVRHLTTTSLWGTTFNATSLVPVTIGGQATALRPGQETTTSGKTVSLAQAGDSLYVNGVPTPVWHGTGAASSTPHPVLVTLAGHTTSLRPGQSVTMASSTFSLGLAGQTLWINGSPKPITSVVAANFTITPAVMVTIAGKTTSMRPGQRVTNMTCGTEASECGSGCQRNFGQCWPPGKSSFLPSSSVWTGKMESSKCPAAIIAAITPPIPPPAIVGIRGIDIIHGIIPVPDIIIPPGACCPAGVTAINIAGLLVLPKYPKFPLWPFKFPPKRICIKIWFVNTCPSPATDENEKTNNEDEDKPEDNEKPKPFALDKPPGDETPTSSPTSSQSCTETHTATRVTAYCSSVTKFASANGTMTVPIGMPAASTTCGREDGEEPSCPIFIEPVIEYLNDTALCPVMDLVKIEYLNETASCPVNDLVKVEYLDDDTCPLWNGTFPKPSPLDDQGSDDSPSCSNATLILQTDNALEGGAICPAPLSNYTITPLADQGDYVRPKSCPYAYGTTVSPDDDQGQDGAQIDFCAFGNATIVSPDDDQGQDGVMEDACGIGPQVTILPLDDLPTSTFASMTPEPTSKATSALETTTSLTAKKTTSMESKSTSVLVPPKPTSTCAAYGKNGSCCAAPIVGADGECLSVVYCPGDRDHPVGKILADGSCCSNWVVDKTGKCCTWPPAKNKDDICDDPPPLPAYQQGCKGINALGLVTDWKSYSECQSSKSVAATEKPTSTTAAVIITGKKDGKDQCACVGNIGYDVTIPAVSTCGVTICPNPNPDFGKGWQEGVADSQPAVTLLSHKIDEVASTAASPGSTPTAVPGPTAKPLSKPLPTTSAVAKDTGSKQTLPEVKSGTAATSESTKAASKASMEPPKEGI
ncbi:hypothetical protein B0A48_11594 [Cryoendolithus antarcticus]|uniref:VWFD domain-containing protein n=1 Tax=Cryoendolithus antarcticus TaxID=1507870 RepID=A0A1V8SWG9_9PEZI|nr:hypothetical protein B0A48_11594 [Cryoendolithus antarcticus]